MHYNLHQDALDYRAPLVEVRQTDDFADWMTGLRDFKTKAKINIRVRRFSLGNPGDVRPVGEEVSELRVDYGPGYRVYFVQRGSVLAILLCGGDKRTQEHDIVRAKRMAGEL